MDKPREGLVSKQDLESQNKQAGVVLAIKSQGTGIQGVPLRLGL